MDILVVGAGVVGLAVARALALRGHAVVVAEAGPRIGEGTSSRNSEVIHAGLYYPADSLKARHCVGGRRALYAYCASHGVPHRKAGKLIVATSERERAVIAAIAAQGERNGVENLSLIGGDVARRLEPALVCDSALLSAETGIIDSHALMLALQGDITDAGGMIALCAPIVRLSRQGGRWRAVLGEGEEPDDAIFDAVVNAAGLGAPALASRTDGFPPALVPKLRLAKGNYFACAGRAAFSRLIYPAPADGGLGVHLTLDLAGRMRFGPDVEWLPDGAGEDYAVDPARGDIFYDAVRRYWPALPDGALTPDYAGIRPKLTGPGEKAADFVIADESVHFLPQHVALFGIESPGLTACLSLAEDVADRLD